MASERDIKLRAILEAGRLIAEAKQAEKALGGIETGAKKSSAGLDLIKKGALALGGAFAAAKIRDFARDSVNLAIAAEDAGSKFDAVFGTAVRDVTKFVDEFANKAGFATFEMQDMLATSGNVAQGLGATTQESATLSTTLATLAGDAASFNGATKDTPAVLSAMQSALTGEREALKTYGIVISEADVQTQAFKETGKTTAGELTKLEKAQATVTLITERMGNAVGDLDRTGDSTSNTMARLGAEFKDMQVELGEALVPALQQALPLMESMIRIAKGLVGPIADATAGFAAFAEGLTTEKSIVDVLQLNAALEETAKFAAAGADPLRAAAVGMATLAKEGEATTESIASVQAITKISGAQMEEAARQALEYARANGFSAEQIDALEAAVRRYNQRSEQQIDRFGITADEAHLMGLAVGPRGAAGEMGELEEATDEATTSIHDMIGAQRALIDPIFRARSSLDSLEEAQEATNKARAEFGSESDEFLRAAEAQAKAALDLKADMSELGRGGFEENREALRRLYAEMGFAPAEVAALLAEWDKINQFQFERKTIIVDVSADSRVRLGPGQIGRAAGGGSITQGGLTLVGEEGPEIVDLPTGSTVFPNGTTPETTTTEARPTAVLYFSGNTFGATKQDVQSGVAEALIAAGIAENVIFDGAGL